MMKTKLIYVFLSLVLLSACSGEDYDSPLRQGGEALQLSVRVGNFVTDGAPDTRADDSDEKTAFEEGDRMGIIVLDKDGEILSDNIPYIYSGSAWSFDGNSNEGKVAVNYNNRARTYLAYFPYTKQADGMKSIDGLKEKFQPLLDQRSKDAYRASNLLVWSASDNAPLKKLEINFEHAYCLLSFPSSVSITYNINESSIEVTYSSSLISDVSFTLNGSPYSAYKAADGSHRIIIAPQSISASDRWLITYGADTYSGSMSAITLAEKTRYTLAPLSIGNYSLDEAQVGDFYCKDATSGNGYIIPGDALLTDDQNTACIGIVCCTDANRIGEAAKAALSGKSITTPHGLVMALTNASEGCRWGDTNTDENKGGSEGDPFVANTDNLQNMYHNVDGYAETHWMFDKLTNGGYSSDTYKAFTVARDYSVAVPNNTTGWFIPSMGQWWDILSNLGGIDLTGYQESTSGSTSISGAAQTAVDNMNVYLGKVNGATIFSKNIYFWSSSEYSSYSACCVYFYDNGNLTLDNYGKHDVYANRRVRCVLAF